MFCSKCGKELPEGTNVCPSCGEKMEKGVRLSDAKAYAGQKTQQVTASIQGVHHEFKEERKKMIESGVRNNVNKMFVSNDEQLQMVVEGGYIRNILSGGGLSKEIGAVTDMRLYYRGKNYSGVHSGKEDCTVDLHDITSTGFVYKSSFVYILIAVISWVVGIFMMYQTRAMGPLFLLFLFGLFWFVRYFFSKRTIYLITYGGGSLGMNVSFFGLEDIREFDRRIHMAKDGRLAEFRPSGKGTTDVL